MSVSSLRVMIVALLTLGGGLSAGTGQESALPDGEAKPIIVRSCTSCHGLESITGATLPKETWRDIVAEMRARGADLTDSELPLVIDYLTEHFGPKNDGVNLDPMPSHGD